MDVGICPGQDSSVNASMLEMDAVEGEAGFALGSVNGNCISTADPQAQPLTSCSIGRIPLGSAFCEVCAGGEAVPLGHIFGSVTCQGLCQHECINYCKFSSCSSCIHLRIAAFFRLQIIHGQVILHEFLPSIFQDFTVDQCEKAYSRTKQVRDSGIGKVQKTEAMPGHKAS